MARELTPLVWQHATQGVADFPPDVRDGWLSILRVAYPSCDFESDWPDFEDLITILDEWDAYRSSYEGRPASPDPMQPAHLKKVLLKHLGLFLCERLGACSNGSLDMVKGLIGRAADAQHAIISFNWDLLLEATAADAGVPVSYGGRTAGRLEVAKPHGSLNLAEMSLALWQDTQGSINVHSVSVEFESADMVVVRADNPRDAANRIIHPFKDTLLVEPTARKSYQSAWLDLQWRRAMDMVRAADEIVVIGYSLPNTDFRPRILLQLAGLARDVRPQPQVFLVDPMPETVVPQYEKSFSGPIKPVASSWLDWSEQE